MGMLYIKWALYKHATKLCELHWLLIVQGIHFKQCFLGLQSLNGIAPIAEMCIQ